MRHAEAAHNLKPSLVAGQAIGSPLTPHGLKQAKDVRSKINELRPRYIYYSPALRCRQSAEIIADSLSEKPELIEDSRLLEMDQGRAVGRSKLLSVINPKSVIGLLANGLKFHFPGGESFEQVAERMQAVITDIRAQHKDADVLICTHGLAIRCFLAKHYGWSVYRLLTKKIAPTQLVSLE